MKSRSADVGLTKAKKLVERDRIDVLVGPVTAGVAIAIHDYIIRQGFRLSLRHLACRRLRRHRRRTRGYSASGKLGIRSTIPWHVGVCKDAPPQDGGCRGGFRCRTRFGVSIHGSFQGGWWGDHQGGLCSCEHGRLRALFAAIRRPESRCGVCLVRRCGRDPLC